MKRVKKADEIYNMPLKEQNMYYESPEAEKKEKEAERIFNEIMTPPPHQI